MTLAEMIDQEIARLEAYLVQLRAQYRACANEQTLFPGRDAWTLRENARNEENRQSGLRGIGSAIGGAEEQLRYYREQQRELRGTR